MAACAHASRTTGASLSHATVYERHEQKPSVFINNTFSLTSTITETIDYDKDERMSVKKLPERGWELEAAGPVESETPTAASPSPARTLARTPAETLPVGRIK